MSAEQQKDRSLYLGSADAASIANIEPYGCRRAMVMRKAGVPVDDAERTRERFGVDTEEGPVWRGIEQEPLVRERINRVIGPCHEWRAPWIESTMPPRPPRVPAWLGASPDGILGPLNDEQRARLCSLARIKGTPRLAALLANAGIIEIKTVQQAEFWRIAKAGPRADFIIQPQHQFAATGAPWCLLIVKDAGQCKHLWYLLERDEAWEQETYLPAAYSAWEQIQRAKSGIDLGASPDTWEAFLPPRLPEGSKQCRTCDRRRTCWGSEYLRVMEIPAEGDAASMEGNPEWAAAVGDLMAANEILEEAEQIKEAAAERIKAMMGDRPVAEGAGVRIYYKPQVSKRVDTTALKRDLPEIAAKYTKESTSRPFRAFSV